MEKLVNGKLGTIGDYDLSLDKGKLSFQANAAADGVGLGLSVSVDAKSVVDLIFSKLPQGIVTTEINAAIDALLAAT